MKALTVRQPWAWAILHGGKNIENRTVRTSYRGPLLIHVSTFWKGWELGQDLTVVAKRVVDGVRWPRPDELRASLGMVIGMVDLVDCQPATKATLWGWCGSGGASGCWHWHLANPRPIEPFAAKGRLGLWEVDHADS